LEPTIYSRVKIPLRFRQKHCRPAALGAVAALCVSSPLRRACICHRQRQASSPTCATPR